MQTHETIMSDGIKNLVETGLPWPHKPLSRKPGQMGKWMPKFKGDKIHRQFSRGRKRRSSE